MDLDNNIGSCNPRKKERKEERKEKKRKMLGGGYIYDESFPIRILNLINILCSSFVSGSNPSSGHSV